MAYTLQTFIHRKVFGNYLSKCKPLTYRREDWLHLTRGRERTVRLIIRAMLGVPSAHHGPNEHAMWCFQFPKGSVLTVYLHRGTVAEISTYEADKEELEEAVDYLLEEVAARLRQL
ncbi:MAG: hypothetical protein LOD90_02435 [Symbiobacteriaceae bacterium]|nr:MAG: hypothetical protein DIU55_04450 [Bacillota bacterium]